MKSIVIIACIIVSGAAASCDKDDEIDLTGRWKFCSLNDPNIVKPFQESGKTEAIGDPELFKDVIYIDSNSIDHPYFSNWGEELIHYRLQGDKIILTKDSTQYKYDFTYDDGMLCIQNFCIVKQPTENVRDVHFTRVRFDSGYGTPYVFELENHQEEGEEYTMRIGHQIGIHKYEYDTIRVLKERIAYTLKALSRIPENQINKIYNPVTADATRVSIEFYTRNSMYGGGRIETISSYADNPFEINIFKSKIIKLTRTDSAK